MKNAIKFIKAMKENADAMGWDVQAINYCLLRNEAVVLVERKEISPNGLDFSTHRFYCSDDGHECRFFSGNYCMTHDEAVADMAERTYWAKGE